MEKMIQVLDVTLHCDTAKEAMTKMMEYIQTEPISVVEMVTMQSLVKVLEQEEPQACMQEFDLTFAGNKELLEAAGVEETQYLQEAKSMLFVKMFLKYLHKNHKRIFILAEDGQLQKQMTEYLEDTYSGICIVDAASMEEQDDSEETIINRMNGTEADCVLAFLSSPLQEQFIIRNKALLNMKIWLGLGVNLYQKLHGGSGIYKALTFIKRRFWKKRIEKVQKQSQSL